MSTGKNPLRRWMAGRASAPLITWYGADSVRIELSGTSADNAVAKSVGLFRDELLLDPGDIVWLELPCHWQAPIIAVGAWAAGLTVAVGPRPAAAAATVAAPSHALGLEPLGTPLAVSLHPWGMPLGAATPAGWEDYAAVARPQPDTADMRWPEPGQPWIITDTAQTADDLLATTQTLVRRWALPANGALLSGLAPSTEVGLLACTWAPAAVGGRVILASEADVGWITAQERNPAVATDV